MYNIGEIIRIMLIKRKMTITDLAKKLNSTQPAISRKIKQYETFTVKELKEYCDILGFEVKITYVDKETKEEI